MRWSSMVELAGGDDSATSTVAVIRMSLKQYVWPRVCMAITHDDHELTAEYGSTAGEVANPAARGQLSREFNYFTVCPRSRLRVWSRETRSAVRSRGSLLILQT